MFVGRIFSSTCSGIFLTFLLMVRIEAASVFEVRDVAVDATAKTAAKAREAALAEGETKAFRQLLERLTLSDDHGRLPRMSAGEIAGYVSDFSISDEKTSDVRYLARLHFRFKPVEVRKLLRNVGMRFAETVSKPVLILPVFQPASGLVLWEKSNPWWDAWKERSAVHGLVPVALPHGDLSDIDTLSIKQVLSGEVEALNKLAERYDAGDTLVVYARVGLDPDGSGARRVDISMTRFSILSEPQIVRFTLSQNEGETVKDLLLRGADAVRGRLEDPWKRVNLIVGGDANIIAITVPITGLEDWLELQKQLKSVAVVRGVTIVLISLDEIRVNLNFVGTYSQLLMALQQSDLTLVAEENERVLYPTVAAKRRKS